jgi:hypothetical protein
MIPNERSAVRKKLKKLWKTLDRLPILWYNDPVRKQRERRQADADTSRQLTNTTKLN